MDIVNEYYRQLLLMGEIPMLNWAFLSRRKWALPVLQENLDKVNWDALSGYEWALPLLQENLDKVNWDVLSVYKWALPLLEANPNKINWKIISYCEWALPLLLEYSDKDLDWDELSTCYWALPLLDANIDKVNWETLFSERWIYSMTQEWERPIFKNPLFLIYVSQYIYMGDALYDALREYRNELHEDLIAYIHHPRYVAEHLSFGFDVETYEYPRQHLWSHVGTM